MCLANGERISMGSGMRLIFEVDNLAKASPATVSRCAMVYVVSARLAMVSFVPHAYTHFLNDCRK